MYQYQFNVNIQAVPATDDGPVRWVAVVGLDGYDELSPEESFETKADAVVGAAGAIGNALLAYEDAEPTTASYRGGLIQPCHTNRN
jgi:hypothetical protein